jgi:hypothetical protein
MRFYIIIISCMFLSCSFLFSQRNRSSNELGFTGGLNYYIGDLNQNHFSNSKLAGGLVYRRNLSNRISFRLNALYGNVTADDSKSEDPQQLYRNLSFRSEMIEASGQIEINYYRIDPNDYEHFISPFVFFGIGVLKMNPQGDFNGSYYDLQALSTEGQGSSLYPNRTPYKLTQVVMPMGIGVKIYPTNRFGISLEWGMRKMFTDYLDDVSTTYVDPTILTTNTSNVAAVLADKTPMDPSDKYLNVNRQRGNSKDKDWYNFTSITVSFKLDKARIVCP